MVASKADCSAAHCRRLADIGFSLSTARSKVLKWSIFKSPVDKVSRHRPRREWEGVRRRWRASAGGLGGGVRGSCWTACLGAKISFRLILRQAETGMAFLQVHKIRHEGAPHIAVTSEPNVIRPRSAVSLAAQSGRKGRSKMSQMRRVVSVPIPERPYRVRAPARLPARRLALRILLPPCRMVAKAIRPIPAPHRDRTFPFNAAGSVVMILHPAHDTTANPRRRAAIMLR